MPEPKEVAVGVTAQLSCKFIDRVPGFSRAQSGDGLCRAHSAELSSPDPERTQHDRALSLGEVPVLLGGGRHVGCSSAFHAADSSAFHAADR